MNKVEETRLGEENVKAAKEGEEKVLIDRFQTIPENIGKFQQFPIHASRQKLTISLILKYFQYF